MLVRDQTAQVPSGPLRVAAVKVVFVLSGWGRLHTPTGEELLGAGSILTIPNGIECRGFPAEHMRTVTFYIHPGFLADQVRWLSAAHPLVHHLHRALHKNSELGTLRLSPGALLELTPSLLRLAHKPETTTSDFTVLAGASEVFDAVGKLTGVASGSTDRIGAFPRREVTMAVALLQANLNHPWRVDELAREIALSSSQLTRLFRSHVGVAPGTFLRQLRADRLAELLATTDLSVSEAAARAGWGASTLASRSFKQRYGVSPSIYARFHRGEKNTLLTLSDQTS
ncbi:hypothetical protein BAU01nite_35080 [Brevibacterium aurantiacum]|uniref:AraC family transcriptional regulator n=1 Tax=Glutamicibacter arilaitensis TaxID=256701 RepID=A0A2N7S0W3_9MICC|nr:AraC family transcriptional regulator [Glutamicibacter arilaitensis]GEB24775.1 hypothetical protein BAU01nite_35080 [Brevibacterium aurantiacum]